MATMITEVYKAFQKAGIPDADAQAAAEALSNSLEPVRVIRAELTFHRWAFAIVIGLQFVIIGKLFVGH